jgi:4-amino-4-deoxy-L-arabinose transferase-like glycosyltransferase
MEQRLKIKIWDSNKLPIIITIFYFIILGYLAFFVHNIWEEHDGMYYFRLGEQILNGNGNDVKTVNAPIGGPIIYAQINEFIQDGFFTMKIISLLSGTGIVFISYYIIRHIFGSKVALVGQLLIVFSPRLELYSIMALNEMLAILLTILSLFFITKKFVNTQDIVIIGILLGGAVMIRYQSGLIFLGILIFLLIRDKKIRNNLISGSILFLTFLLVISPLLIYNYSTHGNLLDNEPNWFLYGLSKYQTQEWHNNLEEMIISGSKENGIFLDFNLFLKNYFYNLFYHNPNFLFNFNSIEHTTSIIPIIPFLGLITFLGGLIYYFKPKFDQLDIGILSSSIIITTIIIFIFGDLTIHFGSIIFIPIFILMIKYRNNFEKNVLPMIIVPIVFFLGISIVPLTISEHLFMIWIIMPLFSAFFLVRVFPKICSKIMKKEENGKITSIILGIIILANIGFAYYLFEFYLFDESYDGIINEINEIFLFESLEARGLEVKEIGEFLATQKNIEDSYVMSDWRGYSYYANSKLLYATFGEGVKGDNLNEFVSRENWSPYEKWFSDFNSYPMDRHGKIKPIANFLVYEAKKPNGIVPTKLESGQFSDLEILFDPNNTDIPKNFELIYKSNKTGTVVYKIHH